MTNRWRRTRLVTRLARGLLSATAVCLVTIDVVPRPAEADQVADLEARATTISQALVHERLQIDADRQQYSTASGDVALDAQAVNQTAQAIGAGEQRADRERSAVDQQALAAYMDAEGDVSSPEVALLTGREGSLVAFDEYSDIAVADISATLGRLHGTQRALRSEEEALEQRQLQDQFDRQQASTDLARAVVGEEQLQSLQAQVTGELAQAVEAQTADQHAAASWSGSDPVLNPFLQCVVRTESNGDYQAVSPNGTYMGAFQFSQATWDMAATAAGRLDLVGVAPDVASKADQDAVAVVLFDLDGEEPWFDPCRS